jgi:hypothetical protein
MIHSVMIFKLFSLANISICNCCMLKFSIEPYVLCDLLGNFTCLLVSTTGYRPGLSGFGGNEEEKRKTTQSLTTISFGNDLQPRIKDIKSIASESDLMTACAADNKDFYIFSFSENRVSGEKFDSNGNIAV